MSNPTKPTKPTKPGTAKLNDGFFARSMRGDLPGLMRALAHELESGTVRAEAITWSLTEDHLSFTADVNMRPKS